jgi:ABC-type branched-subunit amino acid transport system ATPase component/ABC-type branched-subunit amino acid transport system permease subunit
MPPSSVSFDKLQGLAAKTVRQRYFLLLIALAVAVGVSFLVEDRYVAYLARLTLLNIIVVYALNITLGYAGQASLCIAAIFAVGAYASAIGVMRFGVPFILAWPIGAFLAGLFGILSALPALRLSGAYLAMVSIAFNVVAEQILIHGGDVTGGPVGMPAIPPIEIGTFAFNESWTLALIAACSVLAIFCTASFRNSQWGRAAIALRESELAAQSLGIDTVRLKIAIFFVSSVIAGFAGGLYAHSINYISPDIGAILASFIFVLMLVLGGIGTLWGPLIGACVLTLVPQLLSEFQKYHLLVLGIVLLLAVTQMPKGLVRPGALFSKLRRRTGKPAEPEIAHHAVRTGRVIAIPAGTAPAILSAEKILKRFGGVIALSDAAVEVRPGMIRGMIGPNGSGKSTLVNVLTGFYVPDGGTVRLGDRDITGKSTASIAQAGVVRTFQTPRLFADLTVEENLMAGQFRRRPGSLLAALFGTFGSGRTNAAAASESASLAAAVGLGDLLKREANELAQGNQRLLEIARALSAQPSFLILDEPAAGLSHEDCMNLCTLLEELRAGGLGILLIEHHMDVVMRVCDRITVLNRGAVMAEGTPEEIRANPAVQEAYLGGHSPSMAAAS